ncbi:MAG: hypothetical protein NVV82_26870 [Sporocytophaga sp.]|nr:hypothetical protein [Sporocytophaga sp.]
MKKYYFFTLFVVSILCFSACKKDKDQSPAPATQTSTSGSFVAKIGDDAYSATEVSFIPAVGGTIAAMAKDANGRSFYIAIFEKDFPIDKAVNVAFSSSISYVVSNKTHTPKSGTMTISKLEKNDSGKIISLKGTFSIVVANSGNEIAITEGAFDVKAK